MRTQEIFMAEKVSLKPLEAASELGGWLGLGFGCVRLLTVFLLIRG